MEKFSLERIVEYLPQVSSKRRYWFVRTNHGLYYEDFLAENFIAIGYDEISLSDIQKANEKGEEGMSFLADKVIKQYGEKARQNYIASQLINFTYRIKKGDVVLIPYYSSH